jgi:hypothetical protein
MSTPIVERVVLIGLPKAPTSVRLGARPLEFTVEPSTKTVTVKRPAVRAADDWRIEFSF